MPEFAQLYDLHSHTVYQICFTIFKNAEFAGEITQEAFYRAFIKFGDLRDIRHFLPWVVAIAVHYGYREIQLDQSRFNPLPPEAQLEEGSDSTGHDGFYSEEINIIRRWILTLGESDQQLFLLKYYYYLPNAEISLESGKPQGTVKSRLSYLHSKLNRVIRNEVFEE